MTRKSDDTGERRRAADHISDTALRLATEAAGVGVWSSNLATGETYWSEVMYRLFSVTPGTAVTMETLLERVHPKDVPKIHEVTRRAQQGEGNAGFTSYRIVRPDGEIRWITARGRVIVEPNGEKVFHGVAMDVTTQKEAEERELELRRSAEGANERLGFLAEASHILSSSLEYEETLRQVAKLAVPRLADWCAVDLVDETGRLQTVAVEHQDPDKVRWARELQERYPADPDGPSGSYKVLRTGEPELYREITDEMITAATSDEEQLAILRAIGFSSVMIVPLQCRGQTLGVLSMIYSESSRQYDDEDLQLATQLAERAALAVDNARLYSIAQLTNEELERRVQERTVELADVNAELEAFSYSASHDLRAPLRGIYGFAQALLEDYGSKLDDAGRHYLERVMGGASRMGQIIDSLLALSRLNRAGVTLNPLDITSKTIEVVERLRAEDPNHLVEVKVQDDMTAAGDSGMIRIVLENLIGNAWKFTSHEAAPCIEIGTEENSEGRVFFVRDNGVGFDMEYVDKLFEPFGRLHSPEEFPGAGIGLATVKRIIEKHGGRIWPQGSPGQGATFYFTLPSSEHN